MSRWQFSAILAVSIMSIAVYVWVKPGRFEPTEDRLSERLRYRACDHHYLKDLRVRCFYYHTSDVGGFVLPVALITHKNNRKDVNKRDLLVQIPGGPGQGNMTVGDEIQYWTDWITRNNVGFDILLYDPRGTGEGKHVWDCKEYDEVALDLLSRDVPIDQELRSLNAVLIPCFEELEQHVKTLFSQKDTGEKNFGIFSTMRQAEDVVGIAESLGYQNIHLWGVSYGSRVALVAAQYESVKTLILDSPYPFEKGMFSDWLVLYQHSLILHQRLFQRLMPQVDISFMDLYERVERRLQTQPMKVDVQHWVNGRQTPLVINRHRLLELSFGVLYSSYLYLPYYQALLTYADEGKITDDLIFILEDFISKAFDEGFNNMIYFVTECVDNHRQSEQEIRETLEAYPDIAPYFSLVWEYDVCRIREFGDWHRIHQLSYTDKPTLIFTGEFDPVTPTEWGTDLDHVLPRSRHFNIADEGHGVLFSLDCDWQILRNFFRHHDMNLDLKCRRDAAWP